MPSAPVHRSGSPLLALGVAFAAVQATSGSRALGEVSVVREGRPVARVLLGAHPTPAEAHAAGELRTYVERMSGARLRIAHGGLGKGRGTTRILIGRPETNDAIAELVRSGALPEPTVERLGDDGFMVRTIDRDDSPCLVLCGRRDRGTLYAVYHLLSEIWDVGFFWDGEQVPARRSLAVPTLALDRRPRFAERFVIGPCGCGAGYNFGTHWGWRRWKQYLDWAAKTQLNTVLCSSPGAELAQRRADRRMGVPTQQETPRLRAQRALAHRIADYMRTLDLVRITPIPGPVVTPEFRETYPRARYFKQGWLDLTEPTWTLHPTDPLFAERIRVFIEEYTNEFGTDHCYYGSDPFPEARFQTSDAERDEILASLSAGVMRGIKAADPKGRWHISGWAFVFDTGAWSADVLRRFHEALGAGDALVWDLWAEANPAYNQERANYFYGADWAFCSLHEFGGNDNLRAELDDTIARARAAVDDPRSARLVGFGLTSECFGYNACYYDLLARLAWNPSEVETTRFLERFCARRYGPLAAPEAAQAIAAMRPTVFGVQPGSEAGYQHRLSLGDTGGARPPDQGLTIARSLRVAIDHLLRAADASRQADSPLQHDIVDVARQYVTELFGLHLHALNEAWGQRDLETLRTQAKALRGLLDAQEAVLATDRRYRLVDIANDLESDEPPSGDVRRWLRDEGLTFAVSIPGLLDYQSKDNCELLRHYHRPRVEAFLAAVEQALAAGERSASRQKLDESYRAVEVAWVESGPSADPSPLPEGSLASEAIAGVLAEFDRGRYLDVAKELPAPHAALLNGDFSDVLKGWSVGYWGPGLIDVADTVAGEPNRALRLALPAADELKSCRASQRLRVDQSLEVRLRYYLEECSSTANVNLRVDGFAADGQKRVQAVYHWGGANWDHWNRPPQETGGFWSIRRELAGDPGRWHDLRVDVAADVDATHGAGTWASQQVTVIELTVSAWAVESGANCVTGFVDDVVFGPR